MIFDVAVHTGGTVLARTDNMVIEPGKINFLFGESGIGKTLISKAVSGRLYSTDYRAVVNLQPYDQYLESARCRAMMRGGYYVFQEPSSHLYPLMPIEEQLQQGARADAAAVHEIAAYFWPDGFEDLLAVYPQPNRPSGGEKQRLFLVMAFLRIRRFIADKALRDSLFVFDEPTAYLDVSQRDRFLDYLLIHHRKKPFTAQIITHDYSVIGELKIAHPRDSVPVVFRELKRTESGLQNTLFDPQRYLEWIDVSPVTAARADAAEPLLTVHSGFSIFNRRYAFLRHDGLPAESLTIASGEMVYLKAPSGAGKTSVAKMICGLLPAKGLDLRIQEHRLIDATPTEYWKRCLWGRRLVMAFQHADEALNPNARVMDVFTSLSRKPRMNRRQILSHLQTLFDRPAAETLILKKIRYLSGGEKQRINLLRVLAVDAPLMIFDEPFNGLDFEATCRVTAWLEALQKTGKGILIISHNEAVIQRMVPDRFIYHLKAMES